MKFSVLMSIYYKESASYFNRAMESIWLKQSKKPDQIVLIKDGKLTNELNRAIEYWQKQIGDTLELIELKENVGLANALNIGLKSCKYNFIARMDTDDEATIDRFKNQLEFLAKNRDIDVVGTQIEEIDESSKLIKDIVKFPLNHKDLYNFFAKRDPLAHPSVMFRDSYFKKAGSYSDILHLAEDTELWYRGFKSGCKFANIDYIGLRYRRAKSFYKRRGDLAKSIGLLKFRLFKINRDLKYGLKADIYAVAYFLISISPSFVKKIAYKIFR